MVHFDYIHHDHDRITGKEKGVWVRNQMCYPKAWDGVKESLDDEGTTVKLIHHPDIKEIENRQGKKADNLTPKQKAVKLFTEAFGYEPDESVTQKALEEQVNQFNEILKAGKQLSGEDFTIEKPVTLDEAKNILSELQQ